MAWRPVRPYCLLHLGLIGELLLEFLLLLVHLASDESTSSGAHGRTDGAAYACALASAYYGTETCAESGTAATAYESAFACLCH